MTEPTANPIKYSDYEVALSLTRSLLGSERPDIARNIVNILVIGRLSGVIKSEEDGHESKEKSGN